MKIIKKIILAVLVMFTFVACASTVNLTGSAAPIKVAQKKVLVAEYTKAHGLWASEIDTVFRVKGWKVSHIKYWEVDNLDYSKRDETFLIVINKMYSVEQGMFNDFLYEGNIEVFDLRTGKKIINYNANKERKFNIILGLSNALGGLIEK